MWTIAARAGLCATTAACLGAAALPAAALAQPAPPMVLSDDPADDTPHVLDGAVHALAAVGGLIAAGGEFTTVTDAHGSTTLARRNLFAFDARTGAIAPLSVDIDGPIYALAEGPGGTVYVGGAFHKVNGQTHRGLAQIRIVDGAVAQNVASVGDGDVRALARSQDWLYAAGSYTSIGGQTRAGLARLDLAGTVDPGFNAQLATDTGLPAKVDSLALAPDGARLAIIGAFGYAADQPRQQVAFFDIDDLGAHLDAWNTSVFQPYCGYWYDTYLRAVDISPDGRYMIIVTTGHNAEQNRLCDTAARFNLNHGGDQQPIWVNHTGGNSLTAVAVTPNAVYIGGHQQWLDNPYGHKSAGPGAIDRPGIAALNPDAGTPLPWNPTRARGNGVGAFLATPDGLYVGSDTDQLGGEYHARIGLFPPQHHPR